jgi:hypothetical protein
LGIEDLVDRLSAIAEELDDLAFDHLREASTLITEGAVADPELLEAERRLARARRSVEKAIVVLRGPAESD